MNTVEQEKRSNGTVIAGGVCLVLAFFSSMVPVVGWLGGVAFALCAFILGIIACAQARPLDGVVAILGSLIVVPIGAVVGWVVIVVLSKAGAEAAKPSRAPAAVEAAAVVPATPSAEAFGEVLARAEKGEAEAEFEVGLRYLVGQSVSQDKTEAARWFSMAAKQGHARADAELKTLHAARH